MKPETIVVIPAFNEALVIGRVVRGVRGQGYRQIVVVDDGSTDRTAAAAKKSGALVAAHRLNRGKGAAVKTGLEAALALGGDIIVTMDGDGQHAPEDIRALEEPIARGLCEVSLGTRMWPGSPMPASRFLQNLMANGLTWAVHRQWVADSQSGFRAYSARAARTIDVTADFYDYDSEVIREIRRHRLSFQEIPVKVRYTSHSLSKVHKQSLSNGIKTVARMLWQLIS